MTRSPHGLEAGRQVLLTGATGFLTLAAVSFLAATSAACGPSDPDSGSEDVAHQKGEGAGEPVAGEVGFILAGSDTVASGIVVDIRTDDGERTPAVFRGPGRLAQAVTDGTYEMSGDSLPTRVRALRPGETLRRPDGTVP